MKKVFRHSIYLYLKGYGMPMLLLCLLLTVFSGCDKEEAPYEPKAELRLSTSGIDSGYSPTLMNMEMGAIEAIYNRVFAQHGLATGAWYLNPAKDLDKMIMACREVEEIIQKENYSFKGYYVYELRYKDTIVHSSLFGHRE